MVYNDKSGMILPRQNKNDASFLHILIRSWNFKKRSDLRVRQEIESAVDSRGTYECH